MFQKAKRFFEPMRINWKESLKMIIFRLVLCIYTVAIVFFAQKFVELIEIKDIESIKTYTIYFAIMSIAFVIFYKTLRRWDWADFYHSNMILLDKEYMAKFITLDNIFIENLGTGKLISILSKGKQNWIDFLMQIVRIVSEVFVYMISTIIILQNVGNIYVVIFFIVIVFIMFVLLKINSKALPQRKMVTEQRIEYDRKITKVVMSKFEILQSNKIDYEVNVLVKQMQKIRQEVNKLWTYTMNMFIFPEAILALLYIAFLLLVVYTEISLPIVVSLFMMFNLLRRVFDRMVFFFKEFTKNFYTIEKIWELFDETPQIQGIDTGEEFVLKNGDIEINNITFAYTTKNVFEDFSFNIKGNTKTALVGNSGGGKTTLAKLISGFISPDLGEIKIDGQSLSEVNIMSYYKHIGYLTQDPSVFDGTVIENLLYGVDDNVTDRKLKEAIKKAKCEFIYDLPSGLETEIGERGVRLSGGQKQRLAIAKIFIKNPKVIILDEPTSALDSFNEEMISESFAELFVDRTVVIIAHRLQTVKNADEILVINGGKIIEKGTHNTLIRKGGHYKKMLDLQSGF